MVRFSTMCLLGREPMVRPIRFRIAGLVWLSRVLVRVVNSGIAWLMNVCVLVTIRVAVWPATRALILLTRRILRTEVVKVRLLRTALPSYYEVGVTS